MYFLIHGLRDNSRAVYGARENSQTGKNATKLMISDLPHVRFALSAAVMPRNNHNTRTLIYISTEIKQFQRSATLCSLLARTRALSDECAPRWAHYYYIRADVSSRTPFHFRTSICPATDTSKI